MKVTVTVHGHAAAYFPGKMGTYEVNFERPVPIRDIISCLGANPDLIMTALVDGVRRDKDYVPADGAVVVLISPASGG